MRETFEPGGRRSLLGFRSVSGLGRIGRFLLLMALAGLVGIVAYCLQFSWLRGLSIFGFAVLVAAASLVVGSLFGFIFAIPRRLQSTQPAEDTGPVLERDTNLIQISDWLTKILVGAGLTQVGNVGKAASGLGEALRPGLGDTPASAPLGVAIALAFVVIGFILGYMETRLLLDVAIKQPEIETLGSTAIKPEQE